MDQPTLLKSIPNQITYEGAAYGPFDLKQFIQSDGVLHFSAQLTDGSALPGGLICTQDGLLSGIPAAGTVGRYEIEITIENESELALKVVNVFTIKERLALDDPFFLTNLKSQVWELLGQNLPVPELLNAFERPITPIEIYYLLQRYATLTIWDIYNLDPPGEKKLLTLPNSSPHYEIYDRGSCLVGAPKNLFSHERTLEDALLTSRAMAQEVYRRGWTIEFAGFNKMVRAAWVQLQLLGEQFNKPLEILHYTPTVEDRKIYNIQSHARGLTP